MPLSDYQCIMLSLYSGAFQLLAFMQQAEAERENRTPTAD